ncbi:MAG: hypothetical protein KAH22_05435 [Thiotrichaceae bacterium]|nr:hypothetical protein [Thiotrichaceae bacterium]
MAESTIQTAPMLLEQLKIAGILAFDGKTKEKAIATKKSNTTSDRDTRRVPHLVAIDLVILEQNYGIVMSGSGELVKTFR